VSEPTQPAKPRTAPTPEIRNAVFSINDLIKLAETCSSLEELNAKLREKVETRNHAAPQA